MGALVCLLDDDCTLHIQLAGMESLNFLVGDEGVALRYVLPELRGLGEGLDARSQSWSYLCKNDLEVGGQWWHGLWVVFLPGQVGQRRLQTCEV